MVREHAKQLGDHFVQEIYEIAGDVSPGRLPAHRRPRLGGSSARPSDARLDRGAWNACAATACWSLIDASSASSSGTSSSASRVERDRVLLRPAATGLVRRRDEAVDRPVGLARLAPVVGERLVRLADLPVVASRKPRDRGVPLAARGAGSVWYATSWMSPCLKANCWSPLMRDTASRGSGHVLERAESAARVVVGRDLDERAAPEDAPDHGRVDEDAPLLGRE